MFAKTEAIKCIKKKYSPRSCMYLEGKKLAIGYGHRFSKISEMDGLNFYSANKGKVVNALVKDKKLIKAECDKVLKKKIKFDKDARMGIKNDSIVKLLNRDIDKQVRSLEILYKKEWRHFPSEAQAGLIFLFYALEADGKCGSSDVGQYFKSKFKDFDEQLRWLNFDGALGASSSSALPIGTYLQVAGLFSRATTKYERYLKSHSAGRSLTAVEKRLFKGHFTDSLLNEVRIVDGRVPFYLVDKNYVAITIYNTIYFRSGKYKPNTAAGIELLAHELVHVRQYKGGLTRTKFVTCFFKYGYKGCPYENQAYKEDTEIKDKICLANPGIAGC